MESVCESSRRRRIFLFTSFCLGVGRVVHETLLKVIELLMM